MAKIQGKVSADEGVSGESFEKLIRVGRKVKVVKGGRKMSFAAISVCGGHALIGYGTGKAKEVASAVQKSMESARRHVKKINLTKEGSIFHQVEGHHGATKVCLFPAKEGTGVIAGSATRAMCEACGVKNIVAKCFGSTNPYNVVRATYNAFMNIATPKQIAAKRGMTVEQLFAAGDSNAS